jgi:hypothetical protein
MTMNKSENEVIRNLIDRLRGGSASAEVTAHLQDRSVKLFLETWVIGPMELIAEEDRSKRDLELAVRMSR